LPIGAQDAILPHEWQSPVGRRIGLGDWGRMEAEGAGFGRGALGDATLDEFVAGGAGGIFFDEDDGGPEVGFLFFFFFFRGGFFGGFGVVGFVKLLEEAEFALEGAFGGGFVAKGEIVMLDLIGRPVEG